MPRTRPVPDRQPRAEKQKPAALIWREHVDAPDPLGAAPSGLQHGARTPCPARARDGEGAGREGESETHLVACPARRPAGAERGDRVAGRISTRPALRQGGSGGGGGTGRSLGLGLARLIYVLSRCSLVFLSLTRLLSSLVFSGLGLFLSPSHAREMGGEERERGHREDTLDQWGLPAVTHTAGRRERRQDNSWGPLERDRGPCADRELAMRAMQPGSRLARSPLRAPELSGSPKNGRRARPVGSLCQRVPSRRLVWIDGGERGGKPPRSQWAGT